MDKYNHQASLIFSHRNYHVHFTLWRTLAL